MTTKCKFYREPNGDYLLVWGPGSGFNGSDKEGRAAAIAGLPGSVCTTGMSRLYLKRCRRVKWSQVPRDWRRGIVGPYTTAAQRRLGR